VIDSKDDDDDKTQPTSTTELLNDNETIKTNKDAERAILRVKQKLHGIEYGESLSIQGQVNQLINEATDPERLCKLFPGWAPWV